MQEIKPYHSLSGLRNRAITAADSITCFPKSTDSVISKGELAKAAGVFLLGNRLSVP